MHRSRLIALTISVTLAAGFSGSFCSSTPGLRAGTKIGIVEEMRVGRSFTARMADKYGLVKNAGLTKYLNLTANAVAGVASRSELEFYVAVLNTDEVRAMAGPGGYLMISKGALKKLNNEAELAFVLGQLIAHIADRHMYSFHEEVGSAEVESAVDDLSSTYLNDGLSSDKVMEADMNSVVYIHAVGYDASAAKSAIRSLSSASEYANTHPSADDRAEAIGAFIKSSGISGGQDNAARFKQQVRL